MISTGSQPALGSQLAGPPGPGFLGLDSEQVVLHPSHCQCQFESGPSQGKPLVCVEAESFRNTECLPVVVVD